MLARQPQNGHGIRVTIGLLYCLLSDWIDSLPHFEQERLEPFSIAASGPSASWSHFGVMCRKTAGRSFTVPRHPSPFALTVIPLGTPWAFSTFGRSRSVLWFFP